MDSTSQFGLPLLFPAQAQKHVTLNEALIRLDALAQLRIISFDTTTPPVVPAPDSSYFVPDGASGSWSGRSGQVATFVNGDWVFTSARPGWRAWDEEAGLLRTFDGVDWIKGAVATSPSGAACCWGIRDMLHVIEPGGRNLTSLVIPAMSLVVGVTGRVVESLSGDGLSSWRVGVADDDGRYGRGLGVDKNAYVRGLTGTPIVYYEDTPLVLSPDSGAFAAGSVRLVLNYLELRLPRPE